MLGVRVPPDLLLIKYFSIMFRRIAGFLSDVKQEMSKVSWPSREELIGSTYVVLILSGIMAVYIFGIDTLLSNILKLFLR